MFILVLIIMSLPKLPKEPNTLIMERNSGEWGGGLRQNVAVRSVGGEVGF